MSLRSNPSSCHPEKREYAKGMCKNCYWSHGAPNASKCHPDRRSHARGLCITCYARQRDKNNTKASDCHPDRRVYRKGKCSSCYQKGLRARHSQEKRERTKQRLRENGIRRRYGLDRHEYDEMHHIQNGKCAICADAPPRLSVDHNHVTGQVRALLCAGCNTKVGAFESFRKEAEAYLRSYDSEWASGDPELINENREQFVYQG